MAKYSSTTAVKKIAALKKRIKIIQGGSSAGKTIATLLVLIDKAQSHKNILISVVAETLPHLKKGAMRDFLNIMEGHNYYKEDRWNNTEATYEFETGSKIEFFSADNANKVRGPRRDHLFINEANLLDYETFTQLEIRTNGDIYLDYNPVAEFWAHTEIIPHRDHDFVILTYKDNEALPQAIVDALESRKARSNWWKVYGEGQVGDLEGRIYSGWQIIDEIPHEAKLERYGLDYGYSNDPTAITAVYRYNGGFILDEITYQKGLSNKRISDILLNIDQALVVADSAEPKSNDELILNGVNLIPAEKGPDSINYGIKVVQDQRISVTKRSVNLIKEYRNYQWMKDKDGNMIPTAQDWDNHSLDSVRYAMMTITVDTSVSALEAYMRNNASRNRGSNYSR